MKIAAYLDEVSEDLVIAGSKLKELGITNVVLRYLWGGKSVCEATDAILHRVKDILSDNSLKVVAVVSDAGEIQASSIFKDEVKLRRSFETAKFFGANFLKIGFGTKTEFNALKSLNEWSSLVTQLSVNSNLIPLLEPDDNSYYCDHLALSKFLSENKRIKLLYDPCRLILNRNIDTFTKYWVLLKNNVAAIDVRDLKIGKGYTTFGDGDSGIVKTVKDGLDKWLFLEPSLGRWSKEAKTKVDGFTIAHNKFRSYLEHKNDKLKRSNK